MNSKTIFIIIILSGQLIFTRSYGQQRNESNKNPYSVTTFECASLYWKTDKSGPCKVKFKEKSEITWRYGLDLIYDDRSGEYRGSIVGLRANTGYQVKLSSIDFKTQLDFKGKAPDLGAFETGAPPLQFGRRAYLSYDEDRAPWELF